MTTVDPRIYVWGLGKARHLPVFLNEPFSRKRWATPNALNMIPQRCPWRGSKVVPFNPSNAMSYLAVKSRSVVRRCVRAIPGNPLAKADRA